MSYTPFEIVQILDGVDVSDLDCSFGEHRVLLESILLDDRSPHLACPPLDDRFNCLLRFGVVSWLVCQEINDIRSN